jgi:hypothetical protein
MTHRRMSHRRRRLLASLGIALMVPGAIAAGLHPSPIGYVAATAAIGIAAFALARVMWPVRRRAAHAPDRRAAYHDD